MKNTFKIIIIASVIYPLTGCVKHGWVRDDIQDPSQRQKLFASDNIECRRTAYAAVPIPVVNSVIVNNQVSATANSPTYQTGNTLPPYQNVVGQAQKDIAEADAQRAQAKSMNAQTRAIKEASDARNEIYNSCMVAHEWQWGDLR